MLLILKLLLELAKDMLLLWREVAYVSGKRVSADWLGISGLCYAKVRVILTWEERQEAC
jgi:hypothetical protein